MKVVDLGECRDLLRRWEDVRTLIVQGRIQALAMTVLCRDGSQSVHLAGRYSDDPQAALDAALRMSWHITKDKEAPERASGTA